MQITLGNLLTVTQTQNRKFHKRSVCLEQCPSWFDSTVGIPRTTRKGVQQLTLLLLFPPQELSDLTTPLVLEGWKLDPNGVGQWPMSADDPWRNWLIMKQLSGDSDIPRIESKPMFPWSEPKLSLLRLTRVV